MEGDLAAQIKIWGGCRTQCYLVARGLDVNAPLGQRGLHSDEEGALQSVIGREVAGTARLHCRSKHNRKKIQLLYITCPVLYCAVKPQRDEDITQLWWVRWFVISSH